MTKPEREVCGMKHCKRLIACIVEILIGLALLVSNLAGLTDTFWSGMGTALMVIGVIFLIRQIKYKTNETYRESVDVEVNDERNQYLSMKAWSWAGYLFVLIAAVGAIVLKILGRDELVFMASGSVCLIMVLYWLSYAAVRRKY